MGKHSKVIFDEESDSDNEITTQNQYAKNYDEWRKKEELNKLKTKYGEGGLDQSESSSSDDDDEAVELTQEIENDFFKTLACLKKKDPKIYDNNVTFFQEKIHKTKKEKKIKTQPMYLKDYERKLLLEKGGIISDEENEDKSRGMTYTKEQQQIKDELIKGLNLVDDEEDDKTEGLYEIRQKTKEEIENESDYTKFLTGQNDEGIEDSDIKTELKPLKDYWNDPNLDNNEKFLRDYVLKKRYLENDKDDYVPRYEEIIHDSDKSLSGDEKEIEKQEEFEHKFNFRFEEPDQEFIKRYPRTVEHSLRKTDDKRKLKRAEIKERKKKEKEEQMADLRKMQELKLKEIEEKIDKLKEVTGGTELAFQADDIDGDFDPESYDKRMQELFNNDFYEGDETDQKPEFPDLDKELEIENWDRWNGEEYNEEENIASNEPHCEDDNFNMDADYDPTISLKEELIDNSKGRKKRKRKSKVAEALSRPKPKYDPNDKNYEKYFDEYYKLECEDIIGNVPCKFKYREVIPNDFGLTTEEILMAKDKELNRWCSLKKTIQRRTDDVEKYDQIAYAKKATNISLKKKILPSLFSEESAENEDNKPSMSSEHSLPAKTDREEKEASNKNEGKLGAKNQSLKRKKKNKKKKKTNLDNINQSIPVSSNLPKEEKIKNNKSDETNSGGNKKGKKTNLDNSNQSIPVSNNSLKKEKIKSNKSDETNSGDNKKGKKRKRMDMDNSNNMPKGKKVKKAKAEKIEISDSRLAAFGINPKKFKNKLKYGNKNKT